MGATSTSSCLASTCTRCRKHSWPHPGMQTLTKEGQNGFEKKSRSNIVIFLNDKAIREIKLMLSLLIFISIFFFIKEKYWNFK
jgi:hypothetical protein